MYTIQHYVIKFVNDPTGGQWFSPGTPVSSTNKTDRHDVTEILLNVALNTIALILTLTFSFRSFVNISLKRSWYSIFFELAIIIKLNQIKTLDAYSYRKTLQKMQITIVPLLIRPCFTCIEILQCYLFIAEGCVLIKGGPGGSMSYVVGLPNNSYQLCKLQKRVHSTRSRKW